MNVYSMLNNNVNFKRPSKEMELSLNNSAKKEPLKHCEGVDPCSRSIFSWQGEEGRPLVSWQGEEGRLLVSWQGEEGKRLGNADDCGVRFLTPAQEKRKGRNCDLSRPHFLICIFLKIILKLDKIDCYILQEKPKNKIKLVIETLRPTPPFPQSLVVTWNFWKIPIKIVSIRKENTVYNC